MKNYIYSIIALFMVMLCPAQVSISQAEYFWDTDPGTGNGTPVLAADGTFDDVAEQISQTDIATPGVGLHKFCIRIKDNTGVWGPVFTNIIEVQSNEGFTKIAVSQAEYFGMQIREPETGIPYWLLTETLTVFLSSSVKQELPHREVVCINSVSASKIIWESGDRFLPMSLMFSRLQPLQ